MTLRDSKTEVLRNKFSMENHFPLLDKLSFKKYICETKDYWLLLSLKYVSCTLTKTAI